jgi:hypothetical protein
VSSTEVSCRPLIELNTRWRRWTDTGFAASRHRHVNALHAQRYLPFFGPGTFERRRGRCRLYVSSSHSTGCHPWPPRADAQCKSAYHNPGNSAFRNPHMHSQSTTRTPMTENRTSLSVLWTILIVPVVKYCLVALEFGTAHGEGGPLAVYTTIFPPRESKREGWRTLTTYTMATTPPASIGVSSFLHRPWVKKFLFMLTLFGVTLTIADGMLTPGARRFFFSTFFFCQHYLSTILRSSR